MFKLVKTEQNKTSMHGRHKVDIHHYSYETNKRVHTFTLETKRGEKPSEELLEKAFKRHSYIVTNLYGEILK